MINTRSALPRVVFAASVDTEEDNWIPTRNNVTVSNIALLPYMHERMTRLGLRLTYFSTHSVVADASGAAVLRDLKAAGAEIAAHVHPWNTPPLDEPMTPRNSMLKNLPADLQLRKIARLTDRMGEALGTTPAAFRAGRFALGTATVDAIRRIGYRVDSSVLPWIDWTKTDDGPDYFGAPLDVYRLAPETAVTTAASGGSVIEVPVSTGFNRWPFSRWARLQRGLPRKLRLFGVASRAGIVRQVMLSPEGYHSREMLQLARVLVSHGVKHLQMTWHSPSIVPGLSPFTRTPADVERLYRAVAEVLDGLPSFATLTVATVSETANLLAPRSEVGA